MDEITRFNAPQVFLLYCNFNVTNVSYCTFVLEDQNNSNTAVKIWHSSQEQNG